MPCQSWGLLAMRWESCPCGRQAGRQKERRLKKQTGRAGDWQRQIGWLRDGPRREAKGRKEMSGDRSPTDSHKHGGAFTFSTYFSHSGKILSARVVLSHQILIFVVHKEVINLISDCFIMTSFLSFSDFLVIKVVCLLSLKLWFVGFAHLFMCSKHI